MRLHPALLASVAVVPALALSACGGGGSDKDKITSIVKDVGKNPSNLCTKYAAPDLLKQIGGVDKCKALAKADPKAVDPNVKVDSVTVNGSTATAKITGNSGKNTVAFKKENGSWKVIASTG
ncbi:MAG TPA: hypothetical protein VIL64_01735 [Solirubrobacteraceae bacterium]|jgi:hypothetical protein